MSTTLAVLHVLISARSNSRGDGLLMTSPTPSSLMASSTTSSLIASLDPVLVDFWSGFPCPPPWNEGLLFRLNWTACVGQAVGERLKWFLADRCNIPHDGEGGYVPGGGGGTGEDFGGYGEQEGSEACDLPCKVLVGLFCVMFVIGVVIATVFVIHRRRSKRKDQRGSQQTTGGASDRQYTGIHYASASVINREGERPLPPCPASAASPGGGGKGPGPGERELPRQLQAYVYNPRDSDHPLGDHLPGLHLHLCPLSRRAAYRPMEPGGVVVGDALPGDELPHVYDYISDTDSVRWRGPGRYSLPGDDGHEYTYCTCSESGGGGGGGGGFGGGGGEVDGEGGSLTAEYNSSTPRQSEGYYSDHDLGRPPPQHEVSKPYPRYPDRGLAAAGGGNQGRGGPLPGTKGFYPVAGSHPTTTTNNNNSSHNNFNNNNSHHGFNNDGRLMHGGGLGSDSVGGNVGPGSGLGRGRGGGLPGSSAGRTAHPGLPLAGTGRGEGPRDFFVAGIPPHPTFDVPPPEVRHSGGLGVPGSGVGGVVVDDPISSSLGHRRPPFYQPDFPAPTFRQHVGEGGRLPPRDDGGHLPGANDSVSSGGCGSSGGELRFQNPPPYEDTLVGRPDLDLSGDDGYEHPQDALGPDGQRTGDVLTLHPQYFNDYLDGGTSSV